MRRIGVIGESPHDTKPLCEVWNRDYAGKGQFQLVLKRIVGKTLESKGKMERLLRAELKSNKFDGYVFVRDLDAPRSDKAAMNNRQEWFKYLSNIVGKSVLLLHIQDLEAIHFADIETFNKEYKTSISFAGNPESRPNPKSELKSLTHGSKKKYHESHNEKLIPLLDFTKVKAKCQFYRDFVTDLELLLKK